MMDNFFVAAFVLAALSYVALSPRWRRPLPAPLPPGPVGLPLVGSLPFLEYELHSFFARLASVHGPIFSLRLGTKLGVVISSPALAREVLRDQDADFSNRDVPEAARVVSYGCNEIAWTQNGPLWRMLRRVCVGEILCPAKLDAMYYLRRREVRATVRSLHACVGRAVPVGAVMFLATMNVLTRMMWGGAVEEEEEEGVGVSERAAVGKEFRELVATMTGLMSRPNLSDFFPALSWLDLQGIQRQMGMLMKRFDKIFAAIIEERKRTDGVKAVKEDFLEFMLRLEKEGGDGKATFTMTNVKALLMDMVVGGTETTSNTVEWALAEMLGRPEVLRRVQEEVDSAVGRDAVLEESDATKLPYLAAVIKEVFRLHPSLPLLIPHCPRKTCIVGGFAVPAGSRVFVNAWAIHRDPEIWEDPLEFRPERFLTESGKWDFCGNDFRYMPFGSGRRSCAGKVLAEQLLTYMVATLVHAFEWRLEDGKELDLEEKFGIVMKKAQPLMVVPTPRLAEHLYLKEYAA